MVTIIKPAGTPTVATASYGFLFKALNVTQNQIQVFLNGVQVTQFTFGNNIGSFASNLVNGNNTLLVKAVNPDGTDSKSQSIFFKESAITTETTVTSGTTTPTSTTSATSNSDGRVFVCHVIAGGDPVTRMIPANLLAVHLAHGDTQGACPVKTDTVQVAPVKVKTTPPKTNGIEDTEPKDSTHKPTQPVNTPRRPR